MSFMNKVKSGLSEAGSKAKVVVEVNKLKMQLSGKQKDIEKHCLEIGRSVFLAAVGREETGAAADYQANIDEIVKLEQEIKEINRQIRLLGNEKECSCGKSVPIEARFCPSCGHTFRESE